MDSSGPCPARCSSRVTPNARAAEHASPLALKCVSRIDPGQTDLLRSRANGRDEQILRATSAASTKRRARLLARERTICVSVLPSGVRDRVEQRAHRRLHGAAVGVQPTGVLTKIQVAVPDEYFGGHTRSTFPTHPGDRRLQSPASSTHHLYTENAARWCHWSREGWPHWGERKETRASDVTLCDLTLLFQQVGLSRKSHGRSDTVSFVPQAVDTTQVVSPSQKRVSQTKKRRRLWDCSARREEENSFARVNPDKKFAEDSGEGSYALFVRRATCHVCSVVARSPRRKCRLFNVRDVMTLMFGDTRKSSSKTKRPVFQKNPRTRCSLSCCSCCSCCTQEENEVKKERAAPPFGKFGMVTPIHLFADGHTASNAPVKWRKVPGWETAWEDLRVLSTSVVFF